MAPAAFGSPPKILMTPLVHALSPQTTGRNTVASRFTGPAAIRAIPSLRCRPSRSGTSSPMTSVTKAMARVSPTTETGSATASFIPMSTSRAVSRSAMVAAPKADDSRVETVMAIWTAARNRFGSATSFFSRSPRFPRMFASRSIWLWRSEISAISHALKKPPIRMNSSTSRISWNRFTG